MNISNHNNFEESNRKLSLPPSDPRFDRSGMDKEAYIDLLLLEIKDLRALCLAKDNKLHAYLNQKPNSISSPEPSSKEGDDVPQRSARRRNRVSEKRSVETPSPEIHNETLFETQVESELSQTRLPNSIPLSETFRSGLLSAVKRNGSSETVNLPEQEIDSGNRPNESQTSLDQPNRIFRSYSATREDTGVQKDWSKNGSEDGSSDSKGSLEQSEKSRPSGSSYNPRIKLPHTIKPQDSGGRASSRNIKSEDAGSNADEDVPLNEETNRQTRTAKPQEHKEALVQRNDVNSSDTVVVARESARLPSSKESPTPKQSPNSQAVGFQILKSPLPDDDVILFIKPDDLSTVKLEIASTLSYNPRRSDDFNCTLSINDRESGKGMWRVRKSLTQIQSFDSEIRSVMMAFGLPDLPERHLFSSTIPAKVDIRKEALQHYFDAIFLVPHVPKLVLYKICRFISLDFINPLDDFRSGAKLEGFLIRRYKGLGTTWKIRWCQVDGPFLEIYDSPGGPMIEQIRLQGAQIGRQSSDNVAEEKGYRHAFLILESRSKMSSSAQKHFFCAESDTQRDEWVNTLVEFTEVESKASQINATEPLGVYTNASDSQSQSKMATPVRDDEISKDIKDVKRLRKRSFFPFRYKGQAPDVEEDGNDFIVEENGGEGTLESHLASMNLNPEQFNSVFGKDLIEITNRSSNLFNGKRVPSVCFRCLDYLSKTGAIFEEGIFRLSGSASTIRLLKDQFNRELDFNLFNHKLNPDIHTVAGLFKTFLRDLPGSIFGDVAYKELQRMISYNDGTSSKSNTVIKIRDFMKDSSKIDAINFDFCFVVFQLLQSVVSNSSTNLMTLKNVCIVFVPTLRISLEVLSLCITDFDCIFKDGEPLDDNRREILDLQIPSF